MCIGLNDAIKSPRFLNLLETDNFVEVGAAHPNICRLGFECLKEGAAHRNMPLVTVRCTFENASSIFSTNIIATLSLSTLFI